MRDTGTPPRHVPELTVAPAEPLGGDPRMAQDRLDFGRDPDRPRLRERLRGLPAVRAVAARPVPRTIVAVVSALVSGAGVAIYLGGPPEEVTPASEPAPVLRPESWLEVSEGGAYVFEPPPEPPDRRALVEQELARHPADAPVVLALGMDGSLQGVPPGSYRLQATCGPPLEVDWPVRVVVFHDDTESLAIDMSCDGDVHTADLPLHLADYRAYTFFWYPDADYHDFPYEIASRVVVVASLVPED